MQMMEGFEQNAVAIFSIFIPNRSQFLSIPHVGCSIHKRKLVLWKWRYIRCNRRQWKSPLASRPRASTENTYYAIEDPMLSQALVSEVLDIHFDGRSHYRSQRLRTRLPHSTVLIELESSVLRQMHRIPVILTPHSELLGALQL